jgi:hypothetical protein
MKVKDGSGKSMMTKRFQTLQTQLKSLEDKNNYLNSDLRYKNGLVWRDWSVKDSIGMLIEPSPAVRNVHELIAQFQVSKQCQSRWLDKYRDEPISGLICICGHPNVEHIDGGMCQAGSQICYCRKPKAALKVSDVRHFYKATKGPHEAHALVLGQNSLIACGGSWKREILWVCHFRGCNQIKGVNPVRMRNDVTLSLGLSAHDKHKLMCENCLFLELNGS